MSTELSLATLHILALSKALVFAYLAILLFLIFKKKQNPVVYVWLTGVVILLFYVILSWPLKRMLWGTVGDELFVAAFLQKVMSGGIWHDFYYDWLPNFYPPLYFWVTGTLAKFFTDSAIVAHKGGVIGTIILWWFGVYYLQKMFWWRAPLIARDDDQIISSPWYWFILPTIYFLLLDFDAIVFKPYEALAALGLMVWLVFFVKFIHYQGWPRRYYWYLGILAGLLFLLFYFWWLIVIPVILILWLTIYRRPDVFKKILLVGWLGALVSLPFLAPLLWSYFKYGWENWQAIFLVPGDFFSFLPFLHLDWMALWWLAGIVFIIIFYKNSVIKASLLTLAMCYAYQLASILYFLAIGRPWQASKPFLFLGTAAMTVALAYGLIYFYKNYIKNFSLQKQRVFILIFCLLCLPLFAPINFLDDHGVLGVVEKSLQSPVNTINLSDSIKGVALDYKERTWLSSGLPELNAYLPLSYYIGNNIHFSHHAARYSERLAYLEKLTQASTPEDFLKIISDSQPRSIDSLLLYDDPKAKQLEAYPIYLWLDNYPNGGREQVLYLPKKLIDEKYWQQVYHQDNWFIYLKK